jgi:ABC-2 type transport system ATP-binding protein
MPEEVAIRAENVYKDFVLPHEKVSSIKGLVTGITKNRGKRKTKETQHALKDISFEIKQGEFFGIVGRNGSGKSTMLKILAGIYQPTKGKVYTRGKLVPFIELGVGFNPELTGRENVYLNGAMLGFSEKEVEKMYDSIVKFAELERFMDQKLKNYSSGMQVRLAFSMAIRAEADILLIDEVLAVGDADFQRKCYDYFRKLKRDKKTVIFVSHDMEAIREYCDRAVLIENNAIQKIGQTSGIAEEYTRLFTAEAQSTGDETDRWGNGKAKTTDLSIDIDDEHITIKQKITANKDIDGPIPGFRIRDAADKEVTGTNSKIEKQKLPGLKKGQTLSLTWRMPNILSDGKYTLDPAILEMDGITVADWWDGAKGFTIKKYRHLPYSIDPAFELKID